MTKEELEKEAEERATKFTGINFNEPDNYGSEKEVGHFSYYTGYLAGAESREKRIVELEQENEVLAKALKEKGLKWIKGLTLMAIEEAKEQLKKEESE